MKKPSLLLKNTWPTNLYDILYPATINNRTVIIPNSELSDEVIVNMITFGTRRLDLELKFSNSIDFETVKNLISELKYPFAKHVEQ